ncbi:MAG: M20/M25/M40 family metallo-hydrolase [Gemmatimonadaceae bacterium]
MTSEAVSLDPVELAIALMRIDSTSGREGEVISYAHRALEDRGWLARRIPVSDGRDDLLLASDDAPAVTLSTHLDTVPPYIPPRLEGSRLWGRGACDAKGIAAAMICAGERLRARRIPVALLFVVGEETTHDGAAAANRFPTSSRVLIDGEPTESTLAIGTKGAIRLLVETHGEAAHSAYPHLGRSAISELVALLHELQSVTFPRDPTLGDTTVNIGIIGGGVADNVLAPSAFARVMIRLVTPSSEVAAIVREWAAGRATVTEAATVEAVRLRTMPGWPTSVVAYATDIPKLGSWGEPFLFGPGSIRYAHRDDEHVELAELHAAVDAYERLALAALEST